jgi:hypothetical protein
MSRNIVSNMSLYCIVTIGKTSGHHLTLQWVALLRGPSDFLGVDKAVPLGLRCT